MFRFRRALTAMLALTWLAVPQVRAADGGLGESGEDLSIPAEATDATSEVVKKISEATGFDFAGYARGGFYGSRQGAPKGAYTLGGDLQKYRLGNESTDYMEFGIGKRIDLGNGLQAGAFYMANLDNSVSGTPQLYAWLSGLPFAPSLSFWAGQRWRRVADIHVVDKFIMEDGDNFGAGVDGIAMGRLGTINLAVHTSGTIDHNNQPNNARRFNLQWLDIPANPQGTLTLTAGAVGGDFALGRPGAAAGVRHLQKDVLPGLNNSLYLQASSGHAAINGKFYNLDTRTSVVGPFLPGALDLGDGLGLRVPLINTTTITALPGARQRRIVDAVDFQIGRWGGQALAGYQTLTPDHGVQTRDLSVGGRVSYGLMRYVKLLGEFGSTRREIESQPVQRLSKATLAVALSPNTRFFTRPELRLYFTHVAWNAAAAIANAGTFGARGRRSANTFGVQLEVWWK